MSEADIDSVISTIDNTSRYRLQLSELLQSLGDAKAQVKRSADESRQQVKDHIAEIKTNIVQALEDREIELLHEIDTVENTAVNPLVQCETMINSGISQASAVMAEGKGLLMSDHEANKDRICSFSKRTNNLDLNSLPEVPSLADVASLSVHFPPCSMEDVLQKISEYGVISSRAPVQIVEILERPGALLVKWAEIEHEDDNAPDITEFKLQYCLGDGGQKEESFLTVCQGPNMSYLTRHIKADKLYTFRVCCRGDEDRGWSAWCVPQVAMTTLKHNEWCSLIQGYNLSSENQVATIETSPASPLPVLYSSSSSYICGHGLEFSIIDAGDEVDEGIEGGIGLSFNKHNTETLLRPGALFVNVSGQVFIDGKKLTNVLPNLTKGSNLTFATELVQSDKIRVTIETNDKQVTVDWKMEKEASLLSSQSTNPEDIQMYFALQFNSIGWRVLVE